MLKRCVSLMKVVTVLALATAALQLAGCSGGGGGGGSSSSTGTLKLSITDKPSDDYQNVVISIREIRVVPAGMDNAMDGDPGLPLVAHFDTPKVVDVMQLQFLQQALGEVVLPAGTYNQVRLILDPNPNGQGQQPANYLTLKSAPNNKIPLDTPSGQQSGLKVLGPIEVKAGVINAVMIDFDPNTAIVARGNGKYNIKPTGIRLVQMADVLTQFGSIAGTVTAFNSWSSANVSIKRRGTVNDIEPIAAGTIFSSYTSGAWQAPFAAFVPPNPQGVLYKTFVSANGFTVYSSPTVGVLPSQSTDLGVVQLVKSN